MNLDFLKQLSEIPGVPGREERVRELIERHAKKHFDKTVTDAMGSLICTKKPKGRKLPKVLIACHIDEIGFYVRHIDDKGFLRLNNVGGFDTRNLFARRVKVQTTGGEELLGLMNPSGRPIHIAKEEEKKKEEEADVDMGGLFGDDY